MEKVPHTGGVNNSWPKILSPSIREGHYLVSNNRTALECKDIRAKAHISRHVYLVMLVDMIPSCELPFRIRFFLCLEGKP